ncbi:ribonuclease T2 [Auriculariales sp. MPI-PUGE-AT-0066]|nr:ribonuclease T2 [Auriculariales sp. MPI-PUGE-AT-0066]
MSLIVPAILASATLAWPLRDIALSLPRSSVLTSRVESTCNGATTTSCSGNATSGTCCLEAPGGLLVQTQFWDAKPATGPSDSWTVHGLWPDHCDGTFDANCDSSRERTGIADLLESQGAQDTLSFMKTFWKDNHGNDETFWEHEWNKHGTCLSTLEPSCLPSGSADGADTVVYFQRVVELFKTVPTYQWLSEQGIEPSTSKTYTSAQISDALKAASGHIPRISCDGSNLNEVWWYFYVQGSVIDGDFVALDRPGFDKDDCPSNGIKYLPKDGAEPSPDDPTTTDRPNTSTGTETETSSTDEEPTSTGAPTPTSTETGGSGEPTQAPSSFTIIVRQSNGDAAGGLLSSGTWSTQTLATYRAATSGEGFTLTTSKGACAVDNDELSCAGGNDGAVFTALAGEDGSLLLAFEGSTTFSSDAVPNGSVQESVFVGGGRKEQFELALSE